MPSIFIEDDTLRRTKKGILYDFLAPDGSESRDAADVICAKFKEFREGLCSSDDWFAENAVNASPERGQKDIDTIVAYWLERLK